MSNKINVPLAELVTKADLKAVDIFGNFQVMISGISTHAQKTQRGELFVAITGTKIDSHLMISEAVEAGAAALLVEQDTQPYPGVTTIRVPSTRFALGPIAHAFYGQPAKRMDVIGITGTNGKTTSSTLVRSILDSVGRRTGLIGTLGAYYNGKHVNHGTTTPGALELAKLFYNMSLDGIDAVSMECSSHAIDQGRINGIPYKSGALIGVTQDHLDYHGTFEAYVECKKRLFYDYVGPTPGSIAAFNLDDPVGESLSQNYMANHIGFSKNPDRPCAIRAEHVQLTTRGTEFILNIEGERVPVISSLIGAFNVTNMLTAAACVHNLGLSAKQIAHGLSNAPAVPGRFEMIDEGQPFTVIVDYAHTPDALERVLRASRRLCPGKLIVVFGCGGDRDRGKRSIMGHVAGEFSDFVVVTNDNPRTERPEDIAREIVGGILQSPLRPKRHLVQLDRREAIYTAIEMAYPGDVVMIAGKGHEDYQEVHGIRNHFDDREVAREVLRITIGKTTSEIIPQPTMETLS